VGKIIVGRQDRFGVADAYEWGGIVSFQGEYGAALVGGDGKDLSATDDVSILTGLLARGLRPSRQIAVHSTPAARVQSSPVRP
jgi:hypothetical protein